MTTALVENNEAHHSPISEAKRRLVHVTEVGSPAVEADRQAGARGHSTSWSSDPVLDIEFSRCVGQEWRVNPDDEFGVEHESGCQRFRSEEVQWSTHTYCPHDGDDESQAQQPDLDWKFIERSPNSILIRCGKVEQSARK